MNMSTKKRVGAKRLLRMHSNDIKDVQTASAGDIVALAGVECSSGTTFTDNRGPPIVCSSMYVPDPVMSLSVKVNTRDEQPRFQKALQRFQREDPTFTVTVNSETNETIIHGMGELHLEIYCERMRREYNVDIETGEPKVNYREAITSRVAYEYQHKKQTGGRGQYGKVIGYFEPIPEHEQTGKDDVHFLSLLSGNDIPPNYIPSIEKGFRECSKKGLLTGHPVINMRFILEDGASHEVDSSDLSFKLAAAGAFQEFYEEAEPVVLEPLMSVEVTVPTEFQAQVLQSLNSREGSINSTKPLGSESTQMLATVPLRRMFGYSSELRSVTQGQGEFSMEFEVYDPMPGNKQEELQELYKKQLREIKM